MSDPIENINVLVVDDEAQSLQEIQSALKNLGVPDANIRLAQNTDQALGILYEETKNEAEGVRKRISLMLCGVHLSSQSDGATLMGEVMTGMENRPYIVAMSAKDQAPETVELLKKRSDDFLAKGSSDFLGQKLKNTIENTQKFIVDRANETALAEGRTGKGAIMLEGEPHDPLRGELLGDDGPRPVPGAPELEKIPVGNAPCVYELMRSGKLPDLRRPYNPEDANTYPKGTMVVYLDADGTVTKEFVMGRLAEAFKMDPEWSQRFQRILGNLSSAQRKINMAALNRLYVVDQKAKKGEFIKNDQGEKGHYDETIQYMNLLYGKMMTGLSVREVCAMVHVWAQQDAKQNTFEFARPLVKIFKDAGLVPTLITGMPLEAIPAYREALGIDEMCHGLVLRVKEDKNGELIYTGEVEEQGGTESSKENTAKRIKENYLPVLGIGNRKSDLPMLKVVMTRMADQKNAPIGKALFVTNMFSSDLPKYMADIKAGCKEEFRNRHLEFIHFNPDDRDEGSTAFCICEHATTLLMRMERWFQYVDGMEEGHKFFRDKLHGVWFHPKGKTDGKGNVLEGSKGYRKYTPKEKA